MRLALAALLTVVLVPSTSGTAKPAATRETTGVVTREEYARVERGMSRARVERIFGAGVGCVYVKYQLSNTLFIGRQYRNTAGSWVAIGYERPGDGGRARVVKKRWVGYESCFDDSR